MIIQMTRNNLILRGSFIESILGIRCYNEKDLIYVMLNLPYHCNYRCLKCCNVLENYGGANSTAIFKETSFIQLLRAAKQIGIKTLVIAGEGEPLIDTNLRTIVELTSENGFLPYVFINGSLLSEDTIQFLAKHKTSLIIALDSIQPDRYKRLTGGRGNLSTILANIANCRKVYAKLIEEHEGYRIGSLAINMVVNTINCDEVEKVREFCADDIVFVCNQPTRIGLAERNWSILYGETPGNTDVDSIVARMSALQQPLGTTSDGKWCAYMRNGISVSPDGQVLTCAYSLETAGLYNDLNVDDLKATNREVMQSVEEFYGMHGHSRCILRHPKYKDFIAFLKNRRKK